MAYAVPYVPAYSFTQFQTSHPSDPLPASQVDTELFSIAIFAAEIQANLALIQRSDGALANSSVGAAQLQSSLSIGINTVTQWQTATAYVVNNFVYSPTGNIYQCIVSHTSGVFATDFSNGDWKLIVDFTSAITVAVASATATATTAATNAAASATSAASSATSAATSATSAGTSASSATTSASSASTSASAAAASAALLAGMTGTLFPFAGASAPTGFLLCYGQAVSRTTYSALFIAISTTYGVGDGSTTFNIPDMRGRVAIGKDDMGGSAANRITNGNSGITGTTLGATGGDERLHGHTHTATVTDPGHIHGGRVGSTDVNVAGGGGNPSPYTSINVPSAVTGITVANSSTGGGSSQNVQPGIIVNYIIKT